MPINQPFISFTVFSNYDGRLSKKIALDADGNLVKSGTTQLRFGRFETQYVPFDGDANNALYVFGRIIAKLPSNQAVALGTYHNPHVRNGGVMSEKRISNGGQNIFAYCQPGPQGKGSAVTRTKNNFVYPADMAGLLLLDGDGVTCLRQGLAELWPGYVNVGTLVRPSASAGIIRISTGEELASGGEHGFVIISDAGRAEDVLKAFDRLCWAHGQGRIELAKNGDMLERSLVDVTVWSPERLIYEGEIVLGSGLAQRPRNIELHRGGVLDVDIFLAFVDEMAPADKVAAANAAAKRDPALLVRQATIRAKWAQDYSARMEALGVSPEAASRAASMMQASTGIKGTLTGSAVFVTKDGSEIPIWEILLNPTGFDGITGPDPIEGPSYGHTTARVMAKAGQPVVFSFAHGPGIYRLAWDALSVARALVDRRLAVPDELVVAIAGAAMTESEEASIYRAVERAYGTSGVTAVRLAGAVRTTRQKLRERGPLNDRQHNLYEGCKAEFRKVHQREGRVAAIAAVEAVLATAVSGDAIAVLGKVIWFIAARDAAGGPRRPALEHLIDTIAGRGQAARLIDKAVAAIAAGKVAKERAAGEVQAQTRSSTPAGKGHHDARHP